MNKYKQSYKEKCITIIGLWSAWRLPSAEGNTIMKSHQPSQAESITHWIQWNTLLPSWLWDMMLYVLWTIMYNFMQKHTWLFNIIILQREMENVLKCIKCLTKPVHHTAFITAPIYFKWCPPYVNVHKGNANVIVVASSE